MAIDLNPPATPDLNAQRGIIPSYCPSSKPAALVLCFGLLFLGFGGINPQANAALGNSSTPSDTPSKAAAGATTPVETTSFDEVTARLDRGGPFYLYLSTAQWLSELSQRINEWRDMIVPSISAAGSPDAADREKATQGFNLFADLIKKSGLEQVTGVGASSVAIEPGVYRNTFFIHHYKGKETGFLGTAFGAAPHPLWALDLLPADTALATYGDFEAGQLVSMVRDTLAQSGIPEVKQALDTGLAQFSALTGMPLEAVLQSLGGSGGIVLTLDSTHQIEAPMGEQKQSFPTPKMALLIQVKNDRIFQRIDQTLGAMPGIVKTDEAGLRMRTMALPALPAFSVRATVAQWENFLVVASDDQLIRDMIAARKSGKGFKSTPAFAKLAAGLPTEGNGFSLMTQNFTDTWQRVQTEMMKNQPNSTPEQAALIEKMLAAQSMGATYAVSAHVDNGWLTVSKGSQNMNRLLVPLMVVPVGIAAGIALPVYNSVQQKGKATKSLSQAKQIGIACMLYAKDHKGKFPPSLDALTPQYLQDKAVLASPFAPDEPVGYEYKPGLTKNSPPDAVLLEDKFSAKEHQRVVVHADGSGEVTRLPGK